jgi:hypothetical protein
MQDIIHLLGICPENLSHPNLLNILSLNYQDLIILLNKGYEKIKNMV